MLNMQGDPNTAKKTIDVSKELKKQTSTAISSPPPVAAAPAPVQVAAPAPAPAAGRSQPTLSCYYLSRQTWQKKDFLTSKQRLLITEDPHTSDIPVGIPNVQTVNIVLQKLASEWYLIESSNTSLMSANGIPSHQSIIKEGSKHVLFIDKIPIIFNFSSGGTTTQTSKIEFAKGKPEKDEFSLVYEGTSAETRFKRDNFYIFGPSDFCDFKLQNENVWIMIFHYMGCNYLRTIHANPDNPVTVDGVSAENPILLFNDSRIMLGKHAMSFHVDQETNIANQDFNSNSERRSEKLCLLCIDEQTLEKYSFALPPAGKALNVGRDSHCEIHIDSKDVSRKHSQVIIYERSALVFDCYSTNGTFVNGEKIAKRMVHPGDLVCFGDTKFMFCYLE